MNRLKFSLVLLALCAVCTSGFAAPRTRSAAKAIAQEKATELGVTMTSTARRVAATTSTTDEEAAYYIFNNGNNQGFTIVSGDDRMPEIIGYSDEGSIDEDNLPEGLKYILGMVTKTYNSLDSLDEAGASTSSTTSANKVIRKATANTTNKAIGPLMVTQWSQFEPYWNLTPTSSGSQTLTCCVATALAQILYYLYATQDGQTSTSFSNSITYNGTTISNRSYDWSLMLPNYLGSYTDEQAEAVAKLMRDCGYALNVTYGTDESTAYQTGVPNVASTYFGLAQATSTTGYSNATALFKAIDTELNNYRPVQVCGNGHSFVCDGRAADGIYYHFNFGYGGGNGFYSTDGYLSYDASDMETVTGFRLNSSSSTVTTTTGLTVAYKSAVKTLGLRPVGTIPGMYQQSYYETLKGYLDTAKGVIDGTTSVSDVATLINNIGTAVQNMVKYTTPYDKNGYISASSKTSNGTAYRIQTYKQLAGKYGQIGWYFDNDDGYYEGDAPLLSVYGISDTYSGSKWRFIYDSSTNGYYIGNNSLDLYMMGFPNTGYGQDLEFCVYDYSATSSNNYVDPTTENEDGDTPVPVEVDPVSYLGDGTFAVTLRPMADGYLGNPDFFLDCWEENSSESFVAGSYSSSSNSFKVNGGDAYGEYYSRWTLVPVYASGVSATAPTATFSNSSVEIGQGASATQTVTTNSTGTVTYSSSDISVASVDPTTGAVTGVGAGTATITAAIGGTTTYTTSGYAAAVATYTVTVTASGPVDPTATFANAELEIEAGQTATNQLTTNSDGAVTYSTSNSRVAKYDSSTGTVTAVGTGTATITATIAATDSYNAATVSFTVTVVAAKQDQTITLENTSSNIDMMVDETITNAATTDGDGAITYTSSNGSVATVDENGKVTATGIGTATITVTAAATDTYRAATATYTVTVTKNTTYETAMDELLGTLSSMYTNEELEAAKKAGTTTQTISDGLITASTQFSSPYTESSEGSFANLLDGDQSTFWHSKWSGGSVSAGTHYFIVELNEAEQDSILLSMGRRSNATDDHPTQFEVYGSNDNSTWTDICTLSTPFASKTETVTARFGLGASYTYLKFVCTNTGSTSSSFSCRGYFHMGEFQLYRITTTTTPADENSAKIIALDAAYTKYAASNKTKSDVDELRAIIETYVPEGDVNLDGKVDIADITWLIHYLKGNTDIKHGITDVNYDYKTDLTDIDTNAKRESLKTTILK